MSMLFEASYLKRQINILFSQETGEVTFLVRNHLAFRIDKSTIIEILKGIYCPCVHTLMFSEVIIDIKAFPWWTRYIENATSFPLHVSTFAMMNILFSHDIESLRILRTFFTSRWGSIFAGFRLSTVNIQQFLCTTF